MLLLKEAYQMPAHLPRAMYRMVQMLTTTAQISGIIYCPHGREIKSSGYLIRGCERTRSTSPDTETGQMLTE
ncbi:hypothetical protein Plhal304r1_c028g0092801 [Plasmopara halstedii]